MSLIHGPLSNVCGVKLSDHSEAPSTAGQCSPWNHTMYPAVTGTSVLGIKFDGGVMIAADTVGSYGSLAKYRSLSRVMRVNDTTVMGTGGDYADFQFIKSVVEQKVIDDECLADGFSLNPKALHSWLTRVMYNRRSKMNPLWNTYVIAGMQNGEPFLGYIDKLGVAYEDKSVASGYGGYIAQPLLREAIDAAQKAGKGFSEAVARKVIEQCFTVLFYRDARSWNRFQLAVVTKEGATVSTVNAKSDWNIANIIQGYE